jgi:co-chaperonin GroES (HSP10)
MIIDKTKIKPEGARVLIQPFVEEETENGMVITNTQSGGAPIMGEITRVGDKSKYKAGQIVFFAKYSADTLESDSVDGKLKFYITADEEVLAVYENEKPEEKEKYKAIAEKKELKVEALSDNKK